MYMPPKGETALAFSSVCLAESQEHVGRPIALSVGNAVVVIARCEKERKATKTKEKDRKRSDDEQDDYVITRSD